MSNSITCKFGGSSATILNFGKVKQIVKAHADRKYVVISAMGRNFIGDSKTTDMLISLYRQCDSVQAIMRHNLYEYILNKHQQMAHAQSIDVDIEWLWKTALLENQPYTADFVASRGEYVTAYLAAKMLGYQFVDAGNVVMFDSKGKLMQKSSIKLIKKAVKGASGVVMSGYYGSHKGNIVTFERGGSDISGALLALATDSYLYENYIDVDGFLQVNPALYLNAGLLSHIGYEQLLALNQMGADVIHRDSLLPCIMADIPIALKSIYAPDMIGTLICTTPNNNGLLAITDDIVDYCVIKGNIPQYMSTKLLNTVNLLHHTNWQSIFICKPYSVDYGQLSKLEHNIIKAHQTKILYGGQIPIKLIMDCLHSIGINLLYSYQDANCCCVLTKECIISQLYRWLS